MLDKSGRESGIIVDKLVFTAGLCSKPYITHLVGASDLKGNAFHAKNLPEYEPVLRSSENAVVLGGAKMSLDTVHTAAKAGAQVHWAIRKIERGPN